MKRRVGFLHSRGDSGWVEVASLELLSQAGAHLQRRIFVLDFLFYVLLIISVRRFSVFLSRSVQKTQTNIVVAS